MTDHLNPHGSGPSADPTAWLVPDLIAARGVTLVRSFEVEDACAFAGLLLRAAVRGEVFAGRPVQMARPRALLAEPSPSCAHSAMPAGTAVVVSDPRSSDGFGRIESAVGADVGLLVLADVAPLGHGEPLATPTAYESIADDVAVVILAPAMSRSAPEGVTHRITVDRETEGRVLRAYSERSAPVVLGEPGRSA